MPPSPSLDYPFPDQPASGTTLELVPGVRWLRMPLPFALDHVNLWLLEDGASLVAVDSGYGLEEVRRCWARILAADGRPLRRVVVTHCHPDHLGLAVWLANHDDAPILMTQGEFFGGHALWHQLPGYSVTDMVSQFRLHGLDDARLAALAVRGNAYRRGVPELPGSYRRLFDGEQISIGGRAWEVICGHGHSPEHAALHCAELGVLISGDMLLPRISTNVSVYAATPEADPLGWFLDSLQRFRRLPADTLVLPSHGYPFRGIAARFDELIRHHDERCALVRAACREAKCAGELLPTLFPRELDTHQVMFAMGEAIAHLNHLVALREVRPVKGSDGIVRYQTDI
jgi:glyoxylase-like metal-dependent hydrolase (beta-lactamase superfamily II)